MCEGLRILKRTSVGRENGVRGWVVSQWFRPSK